MTPLFADSDAVMIVGTVASCITSVVASITAVYIAMIKSGQAAVEQKMDTAAVLVAKVAEKQDEDRILVATVATKQDQAVLEVKDVKTVLETATVRQEGKIDGLVVAVEAVHKATNSLTDRLVEKTEAEALVRGGMEERQRAETRKPQ